VRLHRATRLCLSLSLWLAVCSSNRAWGVEEGRNPTAAMWLSIAHPGLGEWYLNGWGNFATKCPQNKFWLGFIPFYGWPGYLQVKSAIDARRGETNDDLTFE
jgi:hypothetical protein